MAYDIDAHRIALEPWARVYYLAVPDVVATDRLVDVPTDDQLGLIALDRLAYSVGADVPTSRLVTGGAVGRLVTEKHRGSRSIECRCRGERLVGSRLEFPFAALVGTAPEGESAGDTGEFQVAERAGGAIEVQLLGGEITLDFGLVAVSANGEYRDFVGAELFDDGARLLDSTEVGQVAAEEDEVHSLNIRKVEGSRGGPMKVDEGEDGQPGGLASRWRIVRHGSSMLLDEQGAFHHLTVQLAGVFVSARLRRCAKDIVIELPSPGSTLLVKPRSATVRS